MQHFDPNHTPAIIEMNCFPDGDDETEPFVIFELVVPVAAKVPAPRQHIEVAKLVVKQNSVTSTVPGKILTQLRANNTASNAAWCITATVATARAPRLAAVC